MYHNRKHGFSLIELMVTIAIVAIIAAIAIPSYTSFQKKSRRGEAHSGLNDLAARLEQYYSENKQYTQKVAEVGLPNGSSAEPTRTDITMSANDYYELKINNTDPDGQGYLITAKPVNAQEKDNVRFRLDHKGKKKHRIGSGGPLLLEWI